MEFPNFIQQFLMLFAPQPCYDEIFVHYNFFDVPCVKVVLSKVVGYVIVLGAVFVKIPQIMKIFNAKSSVGLSFNAILLELVAYSGSFVYSLSKGFPFSTYGDGAFILLQTLIIAGLVLVYTGRRAQLPLFVLTFSVIFALLVSPLAPASLLYLLMTANIPVIVTSRMMQAYTNYSNGHTGQLSFPMVLLMFLGAVARILTSLQETGDLTFVFTYVISSMCNGILTSQILYYWNVKPKMK